MDCQGFSTIWVLILIFYSVFLIYLSAYSFHRRYIPGAGELGVFLLTVAFFSLGTAFEISGYILSRIISFVKLGFFWASFTAPAFFFFALRYFNNRKIPLFFYILLFSISLLIGLFGITFEYHTLVYTRYWLEEGKSYPAFHYIPGVIYKIQIAYLVCSSLAGEVLLLVKVIKSKGKVKKQAGMIFLGSIIPTLNAIFIPGRIDGTFDTQPIALMVTGTFVAISLFRYQMLNLVKIAREAAVDSINDLLVVLDSQKVIVDINASGRASSLLKQFRLGRNLPADSEFGQFLGTRLKDLAVQNSLGKKHFSFEQSHYQVRVSRIVESRKNRDGGYVVIVHDVTETVELLEELEQQATVDALTGIFNRRQWINLAKRELAIAGRNGTSLTLIMFDIDHFKGINDNYGHAFGDEVLKVLAGTIQKNLRVSEIFGRYGGEEFCVICSNADRGTGLAIAERMRCSIEEMNLQQDGKTVKVTASFGIYCVSGGVTDSIDNLLRHADTALYRAKNAGRNCCIS